MEKSRTGREPILARQLHAHRAHGCTRIVRVRTLKPCCKAEIGLGDAEPMTLKEVGSEIGITKERVRQVAKCVLQKLRDKAEEGGIESPEEWND